MSVPAGILQTIDDNGFTFSFWLIDNVLDDNDMLIMSGLGSVESFPESLGGFF